jgi:hypothetical protein
LIPSWQGKSFAVPAEIDYDYAKSINHFEIEAKLWKSLFEREVR